MAGIQAEIAVTLTRSSKSAGAVAGSGQLGTRAPIELPHSIYLRWSLDFVSDTLADARRFRILCIVDDFSRECLATVVDTSLSGTRVVRELDRLTRERATPMVITAQN